MQTIICNIMNLDATRAVQGLQNIVRMVVSRVSIVRGLVRSVRQSLVLAMHLAADAKAKPAYTTLTRVVARPGMQEPSSWLCRPCQVGFLGSFDSRSGRVGRG